MKEKSSFNFSIDAKNTIAGRMARGALYDVLGAAKVLGITPNYVRKLSQLKKVASFKILGKIYITKEALSALIRPIR